MKPSPVLQILITLSSPSLLFISIVLTIPLFSSKPVQNKLKFSGKWNELLYNIWLKLYIISYISIDRKRCQTTLLKFKFIHFLKSHNLVLRATFSHVQNREFTKYRAKRGKNSANQWLTLVTEKFIVFLRL